MLASSKSTDKLDDFSSDANSLTNSCPEPPRALHRRPNISISVSSLPTLMTEEGGEATYLQLDEVAMLKDEQKVAVNLAASLRLTNNGHRMKTPMTPST